MRAQDQHHKHEQVEDERTDTAAFADMHHGEYMDQESTNVTMNIITAARESS
jgi:hypothetical protein